MFSSDQYRRTTSNKKSLQCPFLKIKKNCLKFQGKYGLIVFIYGLNFSFKSYFKSISEKKLLHFTMTVRCAVDEFWKTSLALKISWLQQDTRLNKWRKTSFLIYVDLTRVLFFLKASSLKLEQKVHLNLHACQLNYNTKRLGWR